MNRLNIVKESMKNILKMLNGKQSSKVLLVSSAFLLTVSTAPQSYAEDIEIYESLTGDAAASNPQEFRPNILFLLDTSGSMGLGELVELTDAAARPDYDPNRDYGPSNNDDIYVYDIDRAYTGIYVQGGNNNCQRATEFYANNPTFPEYLDGALVWDRQITTTQTINQVCNTNLLIELTESFNARNGLVSITVGRIGATLNLTPGRTYRIRLNLDLVSGSNNDFSAESNVQFFNSSSTNIINFANQCDNLDFSRDTDGVCEFTIPQNSDIRRARIVVTANHDGDVLARARVEETICNDVVTNTPQVTGADWFVSINVPNGSDEVQADALECELDNGIHGASNGSLEVYPQHQEASNTSFNPNYVASANNPNVIDWDSGQFPDRYLFPGNYHDYLQAPIEDLLTFTVNDVTRFNANFDTVEEFCTGLTETTRNRNGGSFLTDDGGATVFFCQTRITALKEATSNILSSLTGARVGMARFNNDDGGSIIGAVADIEENNGAHRDQLLSALSALPASGSTPLHESLNEARLYYQGGDARVSIAAALKSVTTDPNSTVDFPTNLSRVFDVTTDPNALQGNPDLRLNALGLNLSGSENNRARQVSNSSATLNYNSPILSECQDNSIVLLSDGEATSDTADVSDIESFSGQSCERNGSNNVVNGGCLQALASGMATRDIDGDNSNGDNRVYVYTVAFGSDVANSTELEDTSNAGLRPGNSPGDQHFTATNSTSLATAFQTIIRDLVRVEADTFVAPAISVSAFNQLRFNNEVYFAVFEPNDRARWNGNIKGYTIDSQANILDADGNPAVNETTGEFLDSARSFWSDQSDGAEVTDGGFTEQLDLNPVRTLYANILDSNAPGGANNPVVQLTEIDFLATIDGPNSSVSSIGELNFGGDAALLLKNREDIAAWTFGRDIDGDLGGSATDPNFFIGETLHSSPYVLDFGSINTTNPNIDFDSENIIFSLTNQGMVHAIDADDGEELWAYIPDASLFSNLGEYYNNIAGADHTYGLDGEIAFDVERDAATRELTQADIFVGQRRGGSKYFAMNLLNANLADAPASAPVSKLWTLSDLPRMGQSWATPITATINLCDDGNDSTTCNPTEVLVISGGYSESYDNENIAVEDLAGTVAGNAIYIVERATGELLWVAGRPGQVEPSPGEDYAYYTNDDMTHSFPTEPTVLDSNGDGVADLMFAVDIAGRVWRFDFSGHALAGALGAITRDSNDIVRGQNNNPAGSDAEVSAGIIADLSEPGVNRRFYNRLDVSLFDATETDTARYNIVVGSGYRAHPRFSEAAENRIYFVFDRNTSGPLLRRDSNGDFDRITYDYVGVGTNLDNNINIDELSTIGTNDVLDTASVNRHGFFIPLPNTDEKLINPTLTNAGTVIAVTYAPSSDVVANNVVCQRTTGVSFLHRVDLDDGSFTTIELDSDGISARPIVIEVPDDQGNPVKVLVIGTETFETGQTDTDNDGEPNVFLRASKVGEIKRLNWWERNRSLVQ